MADSSIDDPSEIDMSVDETIKSPTSSYPDSLSSQVQSPANKSTEIKKKQDNGNRRISSRVKTKPDYFDASPILPSASKTKSAIQPSPLVSPPNLASNSDIDTTLTTEQSQEDVSSEDETLSNFKKPPTVTRKRPAPKKTTLDVTVKKTKSATKAKKSGKNSTINSSLFDIVKDGKSALMSVINDWIENYQSDKISAMTELIQFFVHCSGCNAEVTKNMLEAEDTVRTIRHLTENFGEQAEEYPIIISRPEFKKFKANFVSFISHLINLSQHSIIYDDDMMDILICWITCLSDSQVRAFRHTSTLAGMKIVSCLIDVALKVGVEMDHTQRQLDAESSKTGNKKSREKIEKLKRRREELNHNKKDLEDMMYRLFSSIFMHRYRDIRPEIRKICIAEMGQWMNKYSQYFLDENYLKYFGWTLYDKVGEVRLQVLNALEEIYKNEDFLNKLELFTNRFQSRLVHMTLDTDTEVAVKAIKLTTLLYKYNVLEEEDCSQVEQLVFCDQRGIAHAAGEFLALRIIRLSLAASPKKIKGSKDAYLEQMNIKAILEFFIKTEIHQHCTYIVDSLWEHTDLLKNWKTLTNLLLHQNSMIDLDDEEESALIDLMCCACKQAATAVSPPGRSLNKKLSIKEKRTMEDDRANLSVHFMEYLPKLVEKYKADVSKTNALLTLPQYFDLELYPEKRLTKNLDTLLEHMEDIVTKSADTELLETISSTYHFLLQNELVIHQVVDISVNRLIDTIFTKFKKSLVHGVPSDGKEKETQGYYNILTGLKRVLAFSKNHDLTDWNVYDDVNPIIEEGVKGNVEDEILKLALHVMFHTFLQKLCAFDSEEPEKVELKQLRKHQKIYVRQLDELLQYGSTEIKTEVFKLFCDFFMFFPRQLLNKEQKFGQIVSQPPPEVQVRMRDYVISHVFSEISDEDEQSETEDEEDEVKSRQLSEKRELLAGFCKLIAYEIFDIRLAAPIYAQFLRAFADYSDIIKQLMSICRENDIVKFSKVLLFALQQAFESLREENEGEIEARSSDFVKIKDLARRFALLLGVNSNQDGTRKSTIVIHREGINYALSYPAETMNDDQQVPDVPPNLLFLEVLHEFVFKIIKTDKKVIIRHFNEVSRGFAETKGHAWSSYRSYKSSLEAGTTGIESETTQSGEAEDELQAAMALEEKKKKKGGNKKSISFEDQAKKKLAPSSADKNQSKQQAAKKKLSMSKVTSDSWLSKKTLTEESDSDEQAPLSKVAKGIPKLNKSADETIQSSADIDFRRSTKKGSVANDPIKLSGETTNDETAAEEDDVEEAQNQSEEEQQEEEESEMNSSIPDDDASSQKSWLESKSSRKPNKDYSINENNLSKRKTLDDSSQDSDVSSVASSSQSREARAAKRRKRGSPDVEE
ncbi:cohesin subunit SA-2-like isoform X2 [Clytia hemisphaerica]|uniref:cohesin subunit SA-2-like isoform X2 n=1 Tax=Clytia hemisphaerica TaxID=252671 RepID=UPI0034D71059